MKAGSGRKSRLALALAAEARAALTDHMAAHVLECLNNCPSIDRIIVLSPLPMGQAEWRRDAGRGLNAELTAARCALGPAPLLVVHGDLPLLRPDEVEALLSGAKTGVAIAPDRHGSGTNALAVAPLLPFDFAFGKGSFKTHCAIAGDRATIIRRNGLSLDVDTPDDLKAAVAAGLTLPQEYPREPRQAAPKMVKPL